jgi:hypothetical protein
MKRTLACIAGVALAVGVAIAANQEERINQPFDAQVLTMSHRGVGALSNGVATIVLGPEIERCSESTCRTVQLTCKGTGSLLWASEVREGKFMVHTDANGNQAQEFWWVVTANVKREPR